jgi:hypothetical protein
MLVISLGIAPALAASAGNGLYRVTVHDGAAGVGIGVYTATTDVLHDVTAAFGTQNVLFGGGTPSTSWTSIRSYTSGTAYSQRLNQLPSPPALDLESFVVAGDEAIPVGTTGFQTHYMITTGNGGNDNLDVRQTVQAVGTTFNDSAVEVSTEIFNIGGQDVEIGIRYLLDFQVGGGDDGPTFQLRNPDGPVEIIEQDIPVPNADTYDMVDNNDPILDPICFAGPFNTPSPLFTVGGSVHGPTSLQPTAPTLLQYVSWPRVAGPSISGQIVPAPDPFAYSVGSHDVATCVIFFPLGDDSGVNYFWGESPGNAISLAPGQGTKVTVYLFAYLPGQPPGFPMLVEDCSDGIDNDGDGLVDQDDPDCDDLLVDLASFEAESGRRGVKLLWSTASEIDNAGFLLLRSNSPDGPYAPVTPSLIPAQGSSISGASYEYEDRTVHRRNVYYYDLVDVDIFGLMTHNGSPIAGVWGKPKAPRGHQ